MSLEYQLSKCVGAGQSSIMRFRHCPDPKHCSTLSKASLYLSHRLSPRPP